MITEADRVIRKMLAVRRDEICPFSGKVQSTRRDLPRIFLELGYKQGAEVGVRLGRYSEILFHTIPDLKMLCIDPYMAYERVRQTLADKWYANAQQRLEHHDVTFIRKTSMDGAKEVPDGSLDFVYIDGNHRFDHVMLDIILWAKKVRKGGIVSGHDYYHFYKGGVIWAVNAYTQAHTITNWYLTKDREGSWFWVKT